MKYRREKRIEFQAARRTIALKVVTLRNKK